MVESVGYSRIQILKCYSLNHLIFFNGIRSKIFDFYIFFDWSYSPTLVVPINIFYFKNIITDKNLYVLGESKIIIVLF